MAISTGMAILGGSVLGGLMSSKASGDAADSQVQASANSDATQLKIANQIREDNAPFRDTGVVANNKLTELMNGGQFSRRFTQADMNADPVYQSGLQFGLDQGTQGINRQAAAGGNFLSGATLKALTRFGNDYGSTKANESYNRFNNDQNSQYNKLAGLSGAGQQATNQISAAGANMANQVSQSQINAGDARASGYMGQAKAWNNAIGQGYNNWQQNQLINQNQLSQANQSSDPIYSLGSQRNWWD
jgi:hypothetical protein